MGPVVEVGVGPVAKYGESFMGPLDIVGVLVYLTLVVLVVFSHHGVPPVGKWVLLGVYCGLFFELNHF